MGEWQEPPDSSNSQILIISDALPMPTVHDVCELLEAFAPTRLAEEWDNVGLLLGDPERAVTRLMTCLTVTPESAREAVEAHADMIVTHHPAPFRPLARVTTESTSGALLWRLAQGGVSVYSPHTALDSAAEGINASLARGLGAREVRPLVPAEADPSVGAGRCGTLASPAPLGELAASAQDFLRAESVRIVGARERPVECLATACGSGGSFVEPALRAGADALLTGEASFHTCLEAHARGLALVLVGHYASERFAVERLAEHLGGALQGVEAWASRDERDPLWTL